MPRFAGMIMRGMVGRGHDVELWTSRPKFGRLPTGSGLIRKWLGYVDQFLVYPRELRRQVDREPSDTLFVVTDQALGMWVPYLAHRPHVIHCHDFLALKSALGEFPENPTRWTGRQYQQLIRKGFARGQAFISVSVKSREDLHRFLPRVPRISEVVYNGLNHRFHPMEPQERNPFLKQTGVEVSDNGFVVHIGGNQWYKNRAGVLEIYRAYASVHSQPLALWMIGAAPTAELLKLAASVPRPGQVHFLTEMTNEQVNAAYSQARALLFPSSEEGFGWPIAEAMAAGCPVITTNIDPMTEVAGDAARLIPRMPADAASQAPWAKFAAAVLNEVVSRDAIRRAKLVEAGRLNAARFDPETALAAYGEIYKKVLTASGN
jgi:glycosyltransferase involved in cell wall biosynthesis